MDIVNSVFSQRKTTLKETWSNLKYRQFGKSKNHPLGSLPQNCKL